MRRSGSISALLALTATLLTTPGAASAAGAPPQPVNLTETFDAGEACLFPIKVVTTGKSGFIDVPNNPTFFGITTAPNSRVTVTNLDTDESVTVNATGAFRFVTLDDGGLQILAGGQHFLYGEPQNGAGALATTGPIVVQVVDGVIGSVDLSGAQVGTCARSSPRAHLPPPQRPLGPPSESPHDPQTTGQAALSGVWPVHRRGCT